MAKKSWNLMKHINPWIEKVEWTPNKTKDIHINIHNFWKLKTKKIYWKQPEKNDALLIEEHQFKWQQISDLKP